MRQQYGRGKGRVVVREKRIEMFGQIESIRGGGWKGIDAGFRLGS